MWINFFYFVFGLVFVVKQSYFPNETSVPGVIGENGSADNTTHATNDPNQITKNQTEGTGNQGHTPTPQPTPQPTPRPTPGPGRNNHTSNATQTPQPTLQPTPQQTPQPTPQPTPQQTPQPTPEPTPQQTPGGTHEDQPTGNRDDTSHTTPGGQSHGNSNNSERPEPNTSDVLNLHVVTISHTDAGWIYTFERYYQGTGTSDGGCVKCILDNVFNAFSNNPHRRYDMSEISFFNRWWTDQSEEKRAAFKEFVKNKQFSFVNGAWVASDEATAYYDDIMDNFIIGHRWIKDTFDTDANIGWQVDSFGNSASHAGLMAQAGFDGMFFSRADYIDRDKRKREQSLQYNWAPQNPHNESVFTQMLYLGYTDSRFVLTSSFGCRTIFCNGNLNEQEYGKVERFVKEQAQSFKTKNVILLVCDDFLFSSGAETIYAGAEAMIQYFDAHPDKKIKAKYSHISDYIAQVREDMIYQDLTATIPSKHDDTFPYIEQPGHVWTGYFTSKPMYKSLVREFSKYYNAAKLFLTKALLIGDNLDADHSKVDKALHTLEQTLSILQHHDSVTGTMKEYVREDYERMISTARQEADAVIRPILTNYIATKIDETLVPTNINYNWLHKDNSYDHIFDGAQTPTFSVFNPGTARTILIKVKVPNWNYAVLDESNEEISADLICHNQDTNSDCFIYYTSDFASYSMKIYKIVPSTEAKRLESSPISEDVTIEIGSTFSLKVAKNLLDFDYKYCLDQDSCTSDSFNFNYYYYTSSYGGRGPPSGAYIFNPASQTKSVYSLVSQGRLYKGKYLTLVQVFRNQLRTDIKILHHQPEKGLEIVTHLDSVQDTGKEIVLLVKSNSIDNGDTVFYTDSNGYYMQKRVKDHKDDYEIAVQEGLAINYYPITSNVYIEDTNTSQRLSLVTDRAQGASSLNKGEIEVMIHRVTRSDDWKGVQEPLQQRDPDGQPIKVTARHYLSYSQSNIGIKDKRRENQYDIDRAPYFWFFTSNEKEFKEVQNSQDEGLVLPNLVKFFVRSYKPNEYIVRLHNLDDDNGKQVNIYDSATKDCSLLNEFAGIEGSKVESVTELAWMTTKNKADLSRNVLDPNSIDPVLSSDNSNIELLPMEIRTFNIKLKAQ